MFALNCKFKQHFTVNISGFETGFISLFLKSHLPLKPGARIQYEYEYVYFIEKRETNSTTRIVQKRDKKTSFIPHIFIPPNVQDARNSGVQSVYAS